MPEQFVARSHNHTAPAWVDELGMLFWKVSVLVIALRLVIVVPSALLLGVFAQSAALLLQGALVLVIAGVARLLWCVLRAGRQARAGVWPAWRAWLRSEWLIRLAIDCVLGSLIVVLGVALATQERLDWPCVAWLAVIGAIRVAFQESSARAGRARRAQAL